VFPVWYEIIYIYIIYKGEKTLTEGSHDSQTVKHGHGVTRNPEPRMTVLARAISNFSSYNGNKVFCGV
jgi:hypothetical protein